MSKQQRVGYAAFAKWELELVKGKARTLVGRYGFTRADLGDIEQELLLQVHLKREASHSWDDLKAAEKTVMDRILNNKIRDMIEAAKTDKRRIWERLESLHQELAPSSSEDPLTYEDFIDENKSIGGGYAKSSVERQEIRLALDLAREKLTDLQWKICQLLREGLNITEVADALQIKRTTLNRHLDRMRKVLYRRGLREYV